MELVLDADGNAAKRVIDTHLTVSQANLAYHDMITQLGASFRATSSTATFRRTTCSGRPRGRRSSTFRRSCRASHNSSSERFFLRDADNVLGHFARIDRSLASRRGDPWEIWQAYRRRELTPEFRPSGRGRPAPPPPCNMSSSIRTPLRRIARTDIRNPGLGSPTWARSAGLGSASTGARARRCS